MDKSYLLDYKPPGLLALGGWPRASQNDLQTFYHDRFGMTVPETLLTAVFPYLPQLEKVEFSIHMLGGLNCGGEEEQRAPRGGGGGSSCFRIL